MPPSTVVCERSAPEKARYIPSSLPSSSTPRSIHVRITHEAAYHDDEEEDDLPIGLLPTSSNNPNLSHEDSDDEVSLAVAARLKEAIPEYMRLEEQERELAESEALVKHAEKRMEHLLAEIRGASNEADYLSDKWRQERQFLASALLAPKQRRQALETLRQEEQKARQKVQHLQRHLDTVQSQLSSHTLNYRRLLHVRERLEALYERVFRDAAADFPHEHRLKQGVWALNTRLTALRERREEGANVRREMGILEVSLKDVKARLLKERRRVLRWAVVRGLREGSGSVDDLPPPYTPSADAFALSTSPPYAPITLMRDPICPGDTDHDNSPYLISPTELHLCDATRRRSTGSVLVTTPRRQDPPNDHDDTLSTVSSDEDRPLGFNRHYSTRLHDRRRSASTPPPPQRTRRRPLPLVSLIPGGIPVPVGQEPRDGERRR
ncbi:uncharacterized protein SPPG_07272 [Spizellomyces punctatus DAOM BR117]|uniref:Uncharacterized protein n=1 Tax=Spizellomyces punctatus (strain DAOM BR117) TaxID=645134 RepID=A0A0L0H8S8_SPIPD|nr:uncharacterized protein SPPG_07272 [Spizellomyces punctatus DAOM BR117]KNC97344.1 hypothetical protein SPPG_07272 [Spizellomyces punctatus DAOM BR117]|eukprot:XP_016605384.1 hypothetical protein SPPG_07272 [Spizellomyces punctatus DAOM BR117]